MHMVLRVRLLAIALAAGMPGSASAQRGASSSAPRIDRDLLEVTVARLERYYAEHRYTVSQVIGWHLARVERLNPTYKALVYVYAREARARAAALDAAAIKGRRRGPLWGVPVVIKDNTDIAGKITANGWSGYAQPGRALVARRNAHLVDLLERAGAVVIGHANMPDLAKSDTNVSSVGGRTGNAYDIAFSPGGSSGGVAVAVALNMAVIGQGSDTGNSIRNPASNGNLVGMFPTIGFVSRSGIHPYDTFRDNAGPMARTVADAAIALDAMAGPDRRDPSSVEGARHRPRKSFTRFLKAGALKGKRFGVPHFVLEGSPKVHPNPRFWNLGTSPETRARFMRALDRMRAAGATIVIDDSILPEEFDRLANTIETRPYREEGFNAYLASSAPETLNSLAKLKAAGIDFPLTRFTDGVPQVAFLSDPKADANYREPYRRLVTLYQETMKKWHLDGFVYPALQVPPPDERKPLPEGWPTDGPYSATGWVNRLRVPSIVVPAGFYDSGLPFGIEISGDFWKDGELLGYAYAFERVTHYRRPPTVPASGVNEHTYH